MLSVRFQPACKSQPLQVTSMYIIFCSSVFFDSHEKRSPIWYMSHDWLCTSQKENTWNWRPWSTWIKRPQRKNTTIDARNVAKLRSLKVWVGDVDDIFFFLKIMIIKYIYFFDNSISLFFIIQKVSFVIIFDFFYKNISVLRTLFI